ncbi:alpha-D-ribose 1-methylphosphonate 5-triphosphate diphosphatase [Tritonibacter horizontis]|uniref:Alpha-D-ribose 1-methylphosphonate 5-triphosphate diphosphatase n=1 Tax=Tritonibacter horizontis TaxID=1768241 RepID=A0A132BX49_9RHOB|nr:alpha-D-ribose 1-methylphosphonate 5-triphosphate diphosphatase [Tritonibacter horizontis]KUP92969.1 alpha-D-ribose 1-methylphosphonate 5-triphosphate diphosphatase [Tritonibacter horizontis]
MWLSDFELVLPDRVIPHGSVRIAEGRIAEIAEHARPGGLQGAGRTLFPGFIDMHGDMIEQELEPRARVDFPMSVALGALDARLAAAGVTTAYASVSFSRGVRDGERRSFAHTSRVIRDLHAARHTARVDHRIHARFDITFDNAVGVLRDLLNEGRVDLVSLMDHTPGQGQYRNLEIHIRNKAAHHGVTETEARQMVTTAIAERTRPQEALLSNMQTVAQMCRDHGVPLASHDDDTRDKAAMMADLGVVISEFPVTQEAAEVAIARGLMTAMGAPNAMRGQSYSGNLSARDAHQAGLLSILAADYHPGAILPAIRALARTDPDGLAGAARMATAHPARALGLSDRGEIALGKKADLSVVDPSDRVNLVLRAGKVIHSDGSLPSPVPTLREIPQAANRGVKELSCDV